jgi:hypothetical protein
VALNNYAGLCAAVARFLNRTDQTDNIPDFIALAEAEINRELQCRQMTGLLTLSVEDHESALPSDFAGVRSFFVQGSPPVPLAYVKPEELDGSFRRGRPERYTITDRITFDPAPDAEYTVSMRYRRRLPPLSSTSSTSWLLQQSPDVYLNGAVMMGWLFLEDPAQAAAWGARFRDAIAAVNEDDQRQAYPSTLNATARAI